MPLPIPSKNEKEKEFISRCVGNPNVNEEFPDNSQRVAVCYSQWRRSKKNDSVNSESKDRSFIIKLDSEKSNIWLDETTGFLHAKAILTRSGVFDYYDEEGNLYREYRSDEEVFDEESIKTLKMKPITDDHPDEMVTVDNIKEFQIGSIGEIIEKKGTYLVSNIVITDKDMVTTILNRKEAHMSTELSCGYTCDLTPGLGIHDKDGYYTVLQKKIRYNHVSIVDRGRAGRNVRIMDRINNNNSKEHKMPEKVQFIRKAINIDSLNLDAITKVVDEESLDLVNTLSSHVDSALEVIKNVKKDRDELQGKLDQSLETVKNLKTKVDSLSNIDSPEITALLNKRRDIEDVAAKLKVDCKDKDSNTIMCDCIKAASENANLDGKSADYISARFDAVKDIVVAQQTNDANKNYANFMQQTQNLDGKKPANPREAFINKDKEQNRK